MHILATTSASIEDLAEPVDLRLPPAEVVALSFTDSDLLALAAAWRQDRARLPSLRLARLKDLRHPMSVDLWIDRTARHAKVILVRLLGGLDWWRYGAERLAELARGKNIALALLPGEDQDDPRLAALSTIDAAELAAILAGFRQGGPANMAGVLTRLARIAGHALPEPTAPTPVPPAAFYRPGVGAVDLASVLRAPADDAHANLPVPTTPRNAPPLPLAGEGWGGGITPSDDTPPASLAPTAALRASPPPCPPPQAGEGEMGEAAADMPGAATPARAQNAASFPDAGVSSAGDLAAASEDALSTPRTLPPPPLWGRAGEGGRTPSNLNNALSLSADAPSPQHGARPRALLLFYRSMWLAGDVAPIDALAGALCARGVTPVPLFLSSLKDPAARAFVRQAIGDTRPDVILTATAFAAGEAEDLFPAGGPPVLQVIPATTAEEAWAESPRGLAAADLAMHVVLPELDGRVLAGAISFKSLTPPADDLAFAAARNAPNAAGIAQAADRAAALVRLARTPRAERRLALLMPDYPGVPGRTGYAVGLDVPESTCRLIETLRTEGYTVSEAPTDGAALLRRLEDAREAFPLSDYATALATLPAETQAAIHAAWGPPEANADVRDGAFVFRAARFGNALVALAPERGASLDRRADYHDPALPPRHALLAFGLWLRLRFGTHALVHMGAHGTLEWLPGKTVALTPACFPQALLGPLPVIYPFIVSNPGEAAQAKRRIAGVTLGHLPPPLASAGLSEAEQRLERLVDEYAQADGLDRRRRERLARLIVETAAETGLSAMAGVPADADPDAALRQIDAWLCDVKDLAVKDGLHIFGQDDADATRAESGAAERTALLTALDGRHVPAGPAGSPSRGRRDVLPTGRNLSTADPRAIPTPTAMDLGRLAADEVVRAFLQEHGDYPRALVIDLWGSATLRTGGEEIAQGLALMGCRPQWDGATGRVTGIEVLPPAVLGRPRVDVTWRISGLFRDIFPAQVALLDAATRAVATRTDEGDDNPLAASGTAPRIFGAAPGAYGAGVEDRLARGAFADRADLGAAYLDHASHAYGGPDGTARPAPGAFAARVAAADGLLHGADDPARDLLDGGADSAFIGGFAAAAEKLGRAVDLIVLDTSDPARPKARDLATALARIVHGRVSQTFIAGQMRHGPRGATELLETVDRLIAFAETTGRVPDRLIDALHGAYLRDEKVRAFLLAQNPAAATSMARRFADARRRGLWHPRRNDIDADLDALRAEAAE
ncbi:cobalt chelatase [Azorhizobium caulinodans ORS 571]|uniref:Cobalt chelatase n=1 Tax=Azorhizobium caulinodans (strain ATCC 43989 / DSM 5975 / JCM 20966 / LMG 6465 / NBRC 14845 / NCIMB 13405 / ORS 571) TaxID=438753 RepID=A8IKP5_AZOC5|nr:cobaltochelatase subunit CobN [Azorhizobium caulinodans]BAF89933.1 cobalt chelatase [Azorhizobium caulinodans ORS 571]